MCRQALSQQTGQASFLQLMGMIRAEQRQFEQAEHFIRQAIQLQPRWPDPHYNLGNVLQMSGKFDQAIMAYREALALRPDWPQAWNNLGLALKENKQLSESIAAFEKSLALNPQNAGAWINLGTALKDAGQLSQSAAAIQRAISINPNLAPAHNNLSVLLKEIGDLNESLKHAQRATELQPGFAQAFNNLGTLLELTGEIDQAMDAYRKAIELDSKYAEAHYNLGNALKSTRRIDSATSEYRQALALKPDLLEADNNLLYAMHFHPDYGPDAIASEHRRWNFQHAEPLKQFIRPHLNDRDPNRRLRVGYISPDFSEHPVGRFLVPLFNEHDHQAFEIFSYSQVSAKDSVTVALHSRTDTWRNISGMSDSDVTDLICQDQIDILIDLTMHMARNRMLVFARKPAPVQVTWLAYCSTTGLDTIDYRISDRYLEPEQSNPSNYSERTLLLPETYWCYQPINQCPETDSLPASVTGRITFGCLNHFSKMSDAAISLWIRILQSVPDSQLLLHAPPGRHRSELLQQFQEHRVDPARLRFIGKLPLPDYFRLYHQIDIALDTFPYAGGTTTCDALWMGVPVITLAGITAVGRGGVSILSNIGLNDLIAETEQRYFQLAQDLALDLARLASLRSTLRQCMQRSPLMDARRFAEDMEILYRQMWHHWCLGQKR